MLEVVKAVPVADQLFLLIICISDSLLMKLLSKLLPTSNSIYNGAANVCFVVVDDDDLTLAFLRHPSSSTMISILKAVSCGNRYLKRKKFYSTPKLNLTYNRKKV